jgi:hypothetical protein
MGDFAILILPPEDPSLVSPHTCRHQRHVQQQRRDVEELRE